MFNPQQFQSQCQAQQQYYQQQHPQYHQQQQSQVYGSYGNFFQQNVMQINAWQAYNMHAENDLQLRFSEFVGRDHANTMAAGIQSEDLCNILNNTPSIRNYYGITWSREMCSILMAMLDRNPDGFMQWPEFKELQQCLLAWHGMFKRHDTDGSGFIEANELNNVIKQFGYQISPNALTTLLKRYSRASYQGNSVKTLIAFDDFVTLSVRLRAYTDAFRKRDRLSSGGGETGSCMFGYDDFLQTAMCL